MQTVRTFRDRNFVRVFPIRHFFQCSSMTARLTLGHSCHLLLAPDSVEPLTVIGNLVYETPDIVYGAHGDVENRRPEVQWIVLRASAGRAHPTVRSGYGRSPLYAVVDNRRCACTKSFPAINRSMDRSVIISRRVDRRV